MNNNLPWDIIIAKFEGISLSEEEQSQLQNWLAADDKNKLLFDELKTLWDSIQAKSANYNPDVDYYWKKFQAYIHKDTIQKEPIKVKKDCSPVTFRQETKPHCRSCQFIINRFGDRVLFLFQQQIFEQRDNCPNLFDNYRKIEIHTSRWQ